MIFPFDDCKFRSVGHYLRWKLGIPNKPIERRGAQGKVLAPKLMPRFWVGDVVRVDDISIEKIDPFNYFVKRQYQSWAVYGTTEYEAAEKAVASLDDPDLRHKEELRLI